MASYGFQDAPDKNVGHDEKMDGTFFYGRKSQPELLIQPF